MKQLLSILLLAAALCSCKKEKDEFMPTNVETAKVWLEYNKDFSITTKNWFSANSLDAVSMPQIHVESELQKTVLFGFYNKEGEYGLYSVPAFPLEYGQENWLQTEAVTFRKSIITIAELDKLREEHPNGLPVQVIVDAFNNGVKPADKITHPHAGEVYAFRSADGTISGLLQVRIVTYPTVNKIQLEIWTAR